MNKKILGILIVVLMVLSVVPMVTVGAMNTTNGNENLLVPKVTHTIEKVQINTKQHPLLPQEDIKPENKIDQKFLEMLTNKSKQETLAEIGGKKVIPSLIISKEEVELPFKVIGSRNIAGYTVYWVLVPVEQNTIMLLNKVASNDAVLQILPASVAEPVGLFKEPDEKPQKIENFIPLPNIQRTRYIKGYNVLSFDKNALLKESRLVNVKREGVAFPKNFEPADIFAVYHHKALQTWKELNITGEGVSVAVLDSGVDFGNPDLLDAYAVDPVSGWPIAFDSSSLNAYMLLNLTFINFATLLGVDYKPFYIYSWYADTSFEVSPLTISGNITIGYKGNYTAVFTTFDLANILDDKERAMFIQEVIDWIGGAERVLLVDDDEGTWGNGNFDYYLPDVEDFYKKALDSLNITYDTITVPFGSDGPSLDILRNYDLVIWVTGGSFEPGHVLTDNDVNTLEQFLDNGGKLWLISQDYIYSRGIDEFASEYLHVTDYYALDIPAPTFIVTNEGMYHAGPIYHGMYLSPTDGFIDMIIPDNESEVLAVGIEALAYSDYGILPFIKLPLNESLEYPTQSGKFYIGPHPDLALWFDWFGAFVLVADPEGKYDTVYVDFSSPYVIDFTDDDPHTKDNPVITLDFWDSLNGTFGSDGYPDLSGGMIYYIADGNSTIPYADVIYNVWNMADYGIQLPVPEEGKLVAFMIGTAYTGGGYHGTLCAAAVAARGRTLGITYGNAPGSKIIAIGSIYTGMDNWIDEVFFAVEGYDGIPYTGDEALVASNSYGISSIINKGTSWNDVFLSFITQYYAPYTTFLFAAGNGGPGYGTVTTPGASPGVITVGAAVEFGYRFMYGYDEGPYGGPLANYGDVVDFSNRGPNVLGQPKPDVLAVGAFAHGSIPVNWMTWWVYYLFYGNYFGGYYASELWAGTSLATPMAAGVTALVYQAYTEAHGTYPTNELVKTILKSSADNVNADVFSQGAGFLNAYRAVKLAMGLDGLMVTPSEEYTVTIPGSEFSWEFTIYNVNASAEKSANVSVEVFQKIDEVELDTYAGMITRIDQYIPEDADLMKITLYYPFDSFDPLMNYWPATYAWFRVYDWTDVDGDGTVDAYWGLYGNETNLIHQAYTFGTSASLLLGNPKTKYHDGMFLWVREAGAGAKIKIEFYKRVPWNWATIDKNSVTLAPSSSENVTVTISVPADAFGVYEAALYVAYDNTETVVPLSVIVAASEPNFDYVPSDYTGLYDNGYVYGYFDWFWRYESGDWRLYYVNVPEVDNGTYLVTSVTWEGYPQDINVHILGPKDGDFVELARGMDGYMGAGMFKFMTSNGPQGEIVGTKAYKPGLYAIWLHNVLYDGKEAQRKIKEIKVGTVKVTPEVLTINTSKALSGELSLSLENNIELTPNINVYGLIMPEIHNATIAPPTGDYDVYEVYVEDSAMLSVVLESIYDDVGGLDLDLFVFYDYIDMYSYSSLVAYSAGPTADESVSITFPVPGHYYIVVESYSNPVPGSTYDLKIYNYEKSDTIKIKDIIVNNTIYNITLEYELPESGEYSGIVTIGFENNPAVIVVPINVEEVKPGSTKGYDLVVYPLTLETPYDVPYVNMTYNVSTIFYIEGKWSAERVKAYVYWNGYVVDIVDIPFVEPNTYYKLTFSIPIMDDSLQRIWVELKSDNDMAEYNNYAGTFCLLPVTPDKLSDYGKVIGGYAIGRYARWDVPKTEGDLNTITIYSDGESYPGYVRTVLALSPLIDNESIQVDFTWLKSIHLISFKNKKDLIVIDSEGNEVFNPFALREVRYALNYLINREAMVKEGFGGNATALFGPIYPAQIEFHKAQEVYTVLNLTSESSVDLAVQIIDMAMANVAEQYSLNLTKVNGTWYFNDEPIVIRSAGWEPVDYYVKEALRKAGFEVVDNWSNWDYHIESWGWGLTMPLWITEAVFYDPSWEDYIPEVTVANVTDLISKLDLIYYNSSEKLDEIKDFTIEDILELLMYGEIPVNITKRDYGHAAIWFTWPYEVTYYTIQNEDQRSDLEKIALLLGILESPNVFLVQEFDTPYQSSYKVVTLEDGVLVSMDYAYWRPVVIRVSFKEKPQEELEQEVVKMINNILEELQKGVEVSEESQEDVAVAESETTGDQVVAKIIQEAGGDANVTVDVDVARETGTKEVKVTAEVNGDHGTVVTLAIVLPEEVTKYEVHVQDADLLDEPYAVYDQGKTIVIVTVKLHSPAIIEVTGVTEYPEEIIGTYVVIWDMLYTRYTHKFDELYNESIKLGIDNETIQEALYYKQLAEQYYEQASSFGSPLSNPIRSLAPIRKAYLNIKKAVEILEKAIEEAESS
ncbi:S8 family serine peptidase [Thermococcus paralvinellae]|uniref:Uncharacterized protein n=1 Tax=Thermococcus paralvinellae TaxID=582419 RepID=W0I0A9_9EURY|nr:S8 family serine peptidase [Thermococcus paralvinellae]AHF79466.1 Hypothetical protein TES1_0069 [Thermococcus paralvinellae]